MVLQGNMPIDADFKTKLPITSRHFEHDVFGEAVERELELQGKNIVGTLGVHGAVVAVDFDLCIADGSCLPVCPVNVFEWLKNPGHGGQNERIDETDKADPVREADCIFCMACETVCPTLAIKIYAP